MYGINIYYKHNIDTYFCYYSVLIRINIIAMCLWVDLDEGFPRPPFSLFAVKYDTHPNFRRS